MGGGFVADGVDPGARLEGARAARPAARRRCWRARRTRRRCGTAARDTTAASSSAAASELERRHDVRRQVAVPQHRRLRLAGGAAGEEQHGGRVRVASPAVGLGDLGVLHRREERVPARPPRGRRCPSMRSATPSPAITNAGAARTRIARSCVVGQPVVHRHERLAGDGGAEQRDRHGDRVLVDERPRSCQGRRPAACRPGGRDDPAPRRSARRRASRRRRGRPGCRPPSRGSCRRAWRAQSDDGKRLGALDRQAASPTDRDPAPGLVQSSSSAVVLGDVALADERALVERRGRTHRRDVRLPTATIGAPPQRTSMSSPAPRTTTTSVAQVTDRSRAAFGPCHAPRRSAVAARLRPANRPSWSR